MANKLNSSPLLLGHSYNMKIPNVYRHRPSRSLRIKKFIDTSNSNIKNYIYKLKFIDTSNHNIKNYSYKLLIVVMLLVLSIGIIPSLLGFRFEAIRSGSMSPALDTGGLAITRPVNPYSIEIGDVIAYYPPSTPDTLVIHRVVGIDNGSPLSFRTKGDANKSIDAALLPAEAVVGQVKFYFPWIGYLIGFTQSFSGFIIFLAIPGIIILYLELNKLWILISPKRTERQRPGNLPLPSFDNMILSSPRSSNPSACVSCTTYRPYKRRM